LLIEHIVKSTYGRGNFVLKEHEETKTQGFSEEIENDKDLRAKLQDPATLEYLTIPL
jgi:hypothetical protein